MDRKISIRLAILSTAALMAATVALPAAAAGDHTVQGAPVQKISPTHPASTILQHPGQRNLRHTHAGTKTHRASGFVAGAGAAQIHPRPATKPIKAHIAVAPVGHLDQRAPSQKISQLVR
jgi:hypothetical protein